MIYIDDDINALDMTAAQAAVSLERWQYAMRYRQQRDRRLSLSAFMLLQRALRLEYGIHEVPPFVYGPHGKPSLMGCDAIHFNLSHCRDAAACAVSSCPVGIDVECIDRYDTELLPHVMNEDEQQLILNSPYPDVAFVRLWTMKESLLKCTGQGISDDIKSILATAAGYRFQTTVYPTFVCTVCTPRE